MLLTREWAIASLPIRKSMILKIVRIPTKNTMPKACVITAITCLAAPKKPTTVSTQADRYTLAGYATHVITTSFTTKRPSSRNLKNPTP